MNFIHLIWDFVCISSIHKQPVHQNSQVIDLCYNHIIIYSWQMWNRGNDMMWCDVIAQLTFQLQFDFIYFWNKIFFQRSTLIGINQHHTFTNSINILTHLIVNIHVKVFEINIIWVRCCYTLVMIVKLMEKQFWFSEN
jgi:hypothetical protein